MCCDLTKYPQGVAAGVLRGAGKPLFGALCNLVGFYIIGLPTGVSLMFAANMGIVGKIKIFIFILCSMPSACQLTFREAV